MPIQAPALKVQRFCRFFRICCPQCDWCQCFTVSWVNYITYTATLPNDHDNALFDADATFSCVGPYSWMGLDGWPAPALRFTHTHRQTQTQTRTHAPIPQNPKLAGLKISCVCYTMRACSLDVVGGRENAQENPHIIPYFLDKMSCRGATQLRLATPNLQIKLKATTTKLLNRLETHTWESYTFAAGFGLLLLLLCRTCDVPVAAWCASLGSGSRFSSVTEAARSQAMKCMQGLLRSWCYWEINVYAHKTRQVTH